MKEIRNFLEMIYWESILLGGIINGRRIVRMSGKVGVRGNDGRISERV